LEGGERGSYVRLLSLLAYELLGGPRQKVETAGLYTPIAVLTTEGNAVLRRGLFDELSSSAELARQLAAAVPISNPAASPVSGLKAITPARLTQAVPLESKAFVKTSHKSALLALRLTLGIVAAAIIVTVGYFIFMWLRPACPARTGAAIKPGIKDFRSEVKFTDTQYRFLSCGSDQRPITFFGSHFQLHRRRKPSRHSAAGS
jgi:hypothetical protein